MQRFAQTVFLVEATDFERFILREQNSNGIAWTEDLIPGEHRLVGTIDKCPVCVNLHWAILNEHRICFWDACSRMVDHHKIETYFNRYFPGVRRVDAGNFHVVLHSLGLPTPNLAPRQPSLVRSTARREER